MPSDTTFVSIGALTCGPYANATPQYAMAQSGSICVAALNERIASAWLKLKQSVRP